LCEPFPRWGFLRVRVRVRFTYGSEFTGSYSETPLWYKSRFDRTDVYGSVYLCAYMYRVYLLGLDPGSRTRPTILGAATASSTGKRSLRRWPFCSFVSSFVGLFLSCVSACDLFSFDVHCLCHGERGPLPRPQTVRSVICVSPPTGCPRVNVKPNPCGRATHRSQI